MSDLISIIVPVYNIAAYLKRCITSILNQTYTNIEIIAVDDGSTDDSLSILQKISLTDNRLYVIHQENGGVTKARLTGVRAARGEWIGFVDGDDEIEPDMYARLLNNAQEYDADISHCGYQMVFPSRIDYYYNTGRLVQQDKKTGMFDLISGRFVEPGLWNKLYHKKLFHNFLHNEVLDYSIRNYEDLLMNFFLFQEADLSIYEDFCPYHYMIRKGSAATSKVNEYKLRDPLQVLKIIRAYTSNDPDLQNCINSRIAGQLIHLATLSSQDQPELIKPYRTKARKELRELLPIIIKGEYSKKLKGSLIVVSFFPNMYKWIHRLYSILNGSYNKYEVK